MKNIQAIKVGNTVNISIDGKLHKKNCGSPKEADELFRLILTTRENPSDENLKKIRLYLNERTRIAMMAGLEADSETQEVFLAGFNTSIPDDLVEVIKEYHENNYPIQAIINFWKLLMINPDKRVRESLFKFIKTHDFVLTDTGYMVVYKAVAYQEKKKNDLLEFVTNQYLHVKKDWSCSPNKYTVYRDAQGVLGITKNETIATWKTKETGVTILGKLGELNAKLDSIADETQSTYTDKHTHSMSIKLGEPVIMDRKECDSDPAVDCSYGLHVGATKYVESFGSNGDAVLVCLVNPAHVVAVPNYDHSKMRVSEYFPIALATYTGGKIDIIEQMYFESDYTNYEEAQLQDMVLKVQAEEKPIETGEKGAPKGEELETRPLSELNKILESRLLDLC